MRKIMFGVVMALAPLSVAASGAELHIRGSATSGGLTVVSGHASGEGRLRIDGHASHGGTTILSGRSDSRSWVWPSGKCCGCYSRPALNMYTATTHVASHVGGYGYSRRASSVCGSAARATPVQPHGYARAQATAVAHGGHAANAYAEASYCDLGSRAVAVAESGFLRP